MIIASNFGYPTEFWKTVLMRQAIYSVQFQEHFFLRARADHTIFYTLVVTTTGCDLSVVQVLASRTLVHKAAVTYKIAYVLKACSLLL